MNDKPIRSLPLLPLRGLTIFPYMVLHFDVGRTRSIAALEAALVNDQEIILVTQKDTKIDEPETDDVFEVGTVSKIKQLLKLPGETIRVLVEGLERGKILEYTKEEPYYEVEITTPQKYEGEEIELQLEAISRNILSSFEDYVKLSNKVSPETLLTVNNLEDQNQLADLLAASILVRSEDKQKVLEAFHPVERLEVLYDILIREIEILQ
ncbi:MAG: endopeptidase La, partial [Clostridiales bacterium]|nr:endopeptidase La [Clostridiales bacterium]